MESKDSIELELLRGDVDIFKRILTHSYGVYRVKDVIMKYVEFSLKCKKYRGQCDWFYFYKSELKDPVNLYRYTDNDSIYVLARYDEFVVLDHPDSEYIYIIALSSEDSAEWLHDTLRTLSSIFDNAPTPEKIAEFLTSFRKMYMLEVAEKKTGLKFKLLLW